MSNGFNQKARLASKEGCCNARSVAMERDASEVQVLMRFSALNWPSIRVTCPTCFTKLLQSTQKHHNDTALTWNFPSHGRSQSHESLPGRVIGSVLIVVDAPKKLSACYYHHCGHDMLIKRI